MTVIIALIVFGVMIGVHEAGHLVSAKLSGVLVHEFAIGMGPKLFSWQGKETKYVLRLLPFGGFCRLEGEDEETDSDRAFCNATPLRKIVILASGAIMNLILGFLIIILFYSLQPQIVEPVVSEVIEQSYAEEVGIKPGDRIVKMNNSYINIHADLRFFMMQNGDKPFKLTIKRNGALFDFENFKPTIVDGNSYVGFTALVSNNTFYKTVHDSFYTGFFMSKLVLFSFKELITGGVSINEASGPVGIVNEIGNAARQGILDLLYIIALITINLGLFNLMPLPALDGGRIFFVLISLVTRRKIPSKIEGVFHGAGLMLLILLMLFITFNDIIKLFG